MFVPLICDAQLISRERYGYFEYEIGDKVMIDFDVFVSLCVIDSDNAVRDSIALRKEMARDFEKKNKWYTCIFNKAKRNEMKPVRAEILEKYYIQEYETAYYVICVFNKHGEKVYSTKTLS